MIHYVSTRGQAGRRSFEDVLLAGLAEDGGLFVPETWPAFSAAELAAMRGLDYPEDRIVDQIYGFLCTGYLRSR